MNKLYDVSWPSGLVHQIQVHQGVGLNSGHDAFVLVSLIKTLDYNYLLPMSNEYM